MTGDEQTKIKDRLQGVVVITYMTCRHTERQGIPQPCRVPKISTRILGTVYMVQYSNNSMGLYRLILRIKKFHEKVKMSS